MGMAIRLKQLAYVSNSFHLPVVSLRAAVFLSDGGLFIIFDLSDTAMDQKSHMAQVKLLDLKNAT
jgi:hypothetical protein